MRILLIGKKGQVGWELQCSLARLGEVIAFDHAELDLSVPDQISSRVRETKPDIIVNAAAYTAVDRAESEPGLALAVNATAPGIIAEEAARLGALLVHYSTDYVFDGTKSGPYTEADPPNPVNVYGATKLAGEQAIQANGCRHLILRTSWVYSMRGSNFLRTMIRLAGEKPQIRVVNDQRGAPTWARDIAGATTRVLETNDTPMGLYHMTSSGETTWFDFARAIFNWTRATTEVVAISSSDYPTAAKRPLNSVLSNQKLFETCGFQIDGWHMGLRRCLSQPERPESSDATNPAHTRSRN